MKLYIKVLLAVLSSLLLSLSFIDNLAFLAWISLVPFFVILENSSLKQSVGLSWITGIGFFAWVTFWFTTYSWAFWFPIIGLLSLYFIFYGITFYYVFSKLKWIYLKISLVSCLWLAGELLRHRTFLAFPWGVLGYSQHNYLSVMQISSFTGVLGVSLLILLSNLAISQIVCLLIYKNKKQGYDLVQSNKTCCQPVNSNLGKNTTITSVKNRLIVFICIFSILVANLIFGFITLENGRNQARNVQKLNIAMVQTNITFDDKYEKDTAVLIPEKYSDELYFKEGTELLVFPESIIWGPITREENKSFYNWLKDTAKKEKLYTMMGQIIWDQSLNYYNVAALYNEDMDIIGIHRKIHPLPCAEYMPYPEVLWFLKFMNIAKLNITPSKGFTLINYPSRGNIGTNICFESTIQLISRTFRKNGANILFTFTDDAGFKDSIASWHHLIFSRVRAVENNSYMVHIGNNGISAIIDNNGRIIARTGLVTKEVLYASVYFNDKKSFYTTFGELLLYIYGGATFCLLVIYLIYISIKKSKKNNIQSSSRLLE